MDVELNLSPSATMEGLLIDQFIAGFGVFMGFVQDKKNARLPKNGKGKLLNPSLICVLSNEILIFTSLPTGR